MIERLARELSPAQALIREIDCFLCQKYLLQSHFQTVLELVEEKIPFNSWQQKRIHALLSPMYLEAAQELSKKKHTSSGSNQPITLELLVARTTWSTPILECSHLADEEQIQIKQRLTKANQVLLQICQELLGDSHIKLS